MYFIPTLYTGGKKKLPKWVYVPLKVGFPQTVATNLPCCRDTSTSRNDKLGFISCSNEKDKLGRHVLRYAWNFERCSAESNKTKILSTYLL